MPDKLWTVSLKHSIYGSMTPTFDPATDSALICDGWGTAFASIRLRRIDLSSGAEAAATRLGNSARLAMFLPGSSEILAVLDNRLVAVDRVTLAPKKHWRSRVPRYADHGSTDGYSTVLMNWMGPSLHVYDLDNESCRRKKVGSCEAIFQRGQESLIFSGKEGIVSGWTNSSNQLRVLARLPQFQCVCYAKKLDLAAIAIGNPFTVSTGRVESHRDSRTIRLCNLSAPETYREYKTDRGIVSLHMNEIGDRIFVEETDRLSVYEIGPARLKELGYIPLPSIPRTLGVFPDRNVLVVSNGAGGNHILSAYSLA